MTNITARRALRTARMINGRASSRASQSIRNGNGIKLSGRAIRNTMALYQPRQIGMKGNSQTRYCGDNTLFARMNQRMVRLTTLTNQSILTRPPFLRRVRQTMK